MEAINSRFQRLLGAIPIDAMAFRYDVSCLLAEWREGKHPEAALFAMEVRSLADKAPGVTLQNECISLAIEIRGMLSSPPERALKKRKSKEDFVPEMRERLAKMVEAYGKERSLVVLDPEIYKTVLARLQPNIDAIPANTPWEELRKVGEFKFTPPLVKYECRLPLTEFESSDRTERRCKGCDGEPEEFYVGSAVCLRTKFHPACAAIIIQAVGKRRFFECMGRLSRHKEDGAPRPTKLDETTGTFKPEVLDCHRFNYHELNKERESALALFLQE